MRSLDPRTPVLVGLGAASAAAPAADLMAEAVRAAGDDAGAPGLLSRIDSIVVPQGTWTLTDPARTVARRAGSPRARTLRCEVGVSQQEVVSHALGLVAGGEADVVVVAGSEARAFERDGGSEEDTEREPPDDVLTRPPDFVAAIEIQAGIVWPAVVPYALIENALGAADGDLPEDHRAAIAALWSRMNAVAQVNPEAAFPAPMDPGTIATPGPRNRPLAYPYNRWHSSQWTVNQATALLMCSAERARWAGVPAERWLFPHVALSCSEAVTLTARRHLGAWPAMGVLGQEAERHLGRPLCDLALAEVYSCFPSAVRVQQRELGLDLGGTPTLTGGMAFAGGPFNHFALLALRSVGSRLREEPGSEGLVTTVSGLLSKPGLAVWSAHPPAGAPWLADLGAAARAATLVVPVVDQPPAGPQPGTVVSFTVTYGGAEGLDPERAVIVAELADGMRTAATCEDAGTACLAVTEGLIGRAVEVKDTTFRL